MATDFFLFGGGGNHEREILHPIYLGKIAEEGEGSRAPSSPLEQTINDNGFCDSPTTTVRLPAANFLEDSIGLI